jgi:hypothetical protein
MIQKNMIKPSPYLYAAQSYKCFSNTPYAQKNWGEKDNQTISDVQVETTSSTKEVTSVDADKPINFPPIDSSSMNMYEEPRFLEQVQLFVDKAASKTSV